jgi:RNA polymerase sigma-70 factor (family 1)
MDQLSVYNEKELLALVAGGDEKAFRKLFHQYWDNIYGVALMLTKSPAMAEDMVQEIFLKLWLKREQLGEVDNFQNYLFIIARNHIFDLLRKKSREQEFYNQLVSYFQEGPDSPEQQLLHKESKNLLQKAINSLPDQQRKVYLLSRDQGLKQDEIAAQLGISKNTVRNHMAKALQTLREVLTQQASGSLLLICIIEASLPV